MRLDTNALYFITKEEIRVLTAIELGMRNHELVPVHIIERISHLKRANTYKVIQLLLKNKLVTRVSKKYEGYRLTYLGYDYLALSVFMKRGHIQQILGKIGVGKESDIYKASTADGEHVVLKFARLGRVSFRAIKTKRDYIQHRKNYNWLYLSRLASVKEFSFMEILYKNGFPTPKPIDSNRHGIVMSLIDGYTLANVKELENAEAKYHELLELGVKFAEHGLIHSDFNEFNLMLSHDLKLYVIDFPQMVSVSHPNAEEQYDRDINGIHLWFTKKYGVPLADCPKLGEVQVKKRLDIEAKASGFLNKALDQNLKQLELLDNYNRLVRENGLNEHGGEYNSDNDEDMFEVNSQDEGEEPREEVNIEGEERLQKEEAKSDGEEEKKEEEQEKAEGEGEDDEEGDEEDEEDENEESSEDEKDKKQKKKEPKVKKTGKDKEEDPERYIDNALKKKFKPRKIIKKNVNKGKSKVGNSDYFF